MAVEEIDLYEVLGIERGATKVEIKKAYHKAALSSHPDKVAEHEREEAEIRFKNVGQAYEILSDEQKRHLYDTHGMSAFEGPGAGAGPDVGMEDLFEQMFGMNFGPGGMGGMPGGMPGGPQFRRPRRSPDENQEYQVTLEELYKGKSSRFNARKNVICTHCKGTGGKEKAKPHECGACGGSGVTEMLQAVGPGLVTRVKKPCGPCKGDGKIYSDRDRCKKCKGQKIVEAKKTLELYIPPGSRDGEKIVLEGEADQVPGQEPGDIVFHLSEAEHGTFRRAGADLSAELRISLAEALTGFNRIVVKHLDGRGIQLKVEQPQGRVLRPDQVLKVKGEGMPIKRSDAKGDLYLVVKIDFPEDGWLKSAAAVDAVRNVLPKPAAAMTAELVDEVHWEEGNIEEYGAGADDEDWEDEDGQGGAQCATQ